MLLSKIATEGICNSFGYMAIARNSSDDHEIDFQALVEKTNIITLVFRNSNSICYGNPIVKKITGYTPQELVVKTNLGQQLQLTQQKVDSAHGSYSFPSNREINILTKDGKQCWLDCSLQTINLGKQPAILVTAVDITSYKQREYQTQKVLQQEQQLAQNKIKFASMVSHELRTPLNVIAFSSNLLQQYCDRDRPLKIKQCLQRIQRGIENISLIIDEVSIIGKAEAQKLRSEPEVVKVNEFCQLLLEDLQLINHHEGQINFIQESDCSIVTLDRNILQLILTNLLENAIKYSAKEQAIDFIVATNDKGITFTIKDRGIGMTERDRQKIFEPFFRGNNVGELPGNGLGLAVVKELVDNHDGQITINSQVGVGTEIIIFLPQFSI